MSSGSPIPTDRAAIGDRLDGLSMGPAVLAGATAVVSGYVLTVVLAVFGASTMEGDITGILTLLAFVFYSAHSVPVSLGNGQTLDWLSYVAEPATADPALPVLVYYAVPIVVLLAGGYVVQTVFVDERLDPVQTAVGIGLFALGYAGPLVLGTLVVVSQTMGGGTARLVTTDAALYGVVYPLVFGLIGAGIATAVGSLDRWRTGEPSESG